MCAFSARAARDELIKWWINLKNGGKKVENKEKYQRRTKKPARKSESSNLLLCCVLCALFGRKKEFSAGRACVLCRALFSFLFLFLFFFKVRMYNLVLRVYVYSRDVGVLDLYSSSASDASVCIGTSVLFGVV